MKNSILHILLTVILSAACVQSNAQTSSRLIGEVDSSQFYDTIYYSYSMGRGGDLNHTMKFDSSVELLPFGVSTDTQITVVSQRFDSKNNIVISIEKLTEPGCGFTGFFYVSKDSNVYDLHNNRIASYNYQGDTIPGDWTPHDSVFYTYDTKNNMLSLLKPNVERDSFSYDASNNLIAQYIKYWNSATSMWVNGDAYIYSYSSGLLRSSNYYIWIATYGAYINGSAVYYYYDSHNNLTRKVQMQTDPYGSSGAPLVYQQIDSNVYNAGDDMTYGFHAQFDALRKTWQYSRDSNVYDGAHNLVADAQQWYDTVSKQYKMTTQLSYEYNALHQMTYTHSLTFVSAIGGDYAKRYYYEMYTPAAVPGISAAIAEIKLFPNPATTELNLQLQWAEPQAFTVALYDMQGRLMRQWSEGKTSMYQKQMPVSMLPAGNYIVSIRGESGSVQKQISIVH